MKLIPHQTDIVASHYLRLPWEGYSRVLCGEVNIACHCHRFLELVDVESFAEVLNPAASHCAFQCSASRRLRASSSFNLSTLVVNSWMAWSVSIFSSVHFSMLRDSFSFNWLMYCTPLWRIAPLFLSQPGTILANSLIPSLIVSRLRRSTTSHESWRRRLGLMGEGYLLCDYPFELCATRRYQQLV